ncbi:MAG: glycoside hydrolase family 32 protein, partial [Candidatus Acidiferrum sp.]
DFRDPKVFWFAPQKKWVMVAVLADERKAVFLDSPDLKTWVLRGSFEAVGDSKGQWECPDLFELPVTGNPKLKKWVLIINRNPGAPAGGTGTEYFVGAFDGAHFVADNPEADHAWADYGKDFYATNSFSDIPAKDGRRIWIGWISNWQYANHEPTAIWRGAQSLPRELSLSQFPDGIRLVQKPMEEAKKLRVSKLLDLKDLSFPLAIQDLHTANVHGDVLEIEAVFAPESSKEIGVQLRKGASEQTLLGFKSAEKEVFLDRTESGDVSFAPEFPGRQRATLPASGRVRLHIFVDRSSVEVFVNDGGIVMTDRIYPSPGSDGIGLYSEDGRGKVVSLSIWRLASIWR